MVVIFLSFSSSSSRPIFDVSTHIHTAFSASILFRPLLFSSKCPQRLALLFQSTSELVFFFSFLLSIVYRADLLDSLFEEDLPSPTGSSGLAAGRLSGNLVLVSFSSYIFPAPVY